MWTTTPFPSVSEQKRKKDTLHGCVTFQFFPEFTLITLNEVHNVWHSRLNTSNAGRFPPFEKLTHIIEKWNCLEMKDFTGQYNNVPNETKLTCTIIITWRAIFFNQTLMLMPSLPSLAQDILPHQPAEELGLLTWPLHQLCPFFPRHFCVARWRTEIHRKETNQQRNFGMSKAN